jgi:two-component system response regulator YesN
MYKVLIVDDEPFILEGLADFINWEDYGLEIAGLTGNGLEAREIIDSDTIHILITDIRMPKMDGLELIQYIRRSEKDIKCIVLSGYSDFAYVKEAARLGIENYLLKPIDENELIITVINTVHKIETELNRKTELDKGYRILRDNILLRLVSGDIGNRELKERADFLNLDLKQGFFLCAIAKISARPASLASAMDRSLLRSDAQDLCAQIIEEQKLGIAFQDMDGDVVLLFMGGDPDGGKAEIKNALSDCMGAVNSALKSDVFVTAGSAVQDYRLICKSYRQAKAIQDNYLVSGYNRILFHEVAIKSSVSALFDMKEDLAALNEVFRSRDLRAVNSVIHGILSALSDNGSLVPSTVQNIALAILFNMVNTVRLLNPNTGRAFDDAMEKFTTANKCKDLGDLENWLKEMAVTCMSILNREDQKRSPLVNKVVEYVSDNYSRNINLKTVASRFSQNALYLGQLFKNEVGETFTNHLNKLRVKRAIELIREDRLKNYEIAEKVGYANTNYFYIIFKKFTGLSPSEFRENESKTS